MQRDKTCIRSIIVIFFGRIIADAIKNEPLFQRLPIAPKYEDPRKIRCLIHFGEIGDSSDRLSIYATHNITGESQNGQASFL